MTLVAWCCQAGLWVNWDDQSLPVIICNLCTGVRLLMCAWRVGGSWVLLMTSSLCICRRKRSRGSRDNHLAAFEHIKDFQDVPIHFFSCEHLIKVWYLLVHPKCCFAINVGMWGLWQSKYCLFPLSVPSSAVVTSLTNRYFVVFIRLKVLWLLSFDDKNTLADAVDKYCIGVPPIQWLAWIPQLLTCLVGSEGKPLLNLISQVRSFVLSKS